MLPAALISALHSFISAQDGRADCSPRKLEFCTGALLWSLVIAFRGYRHTLQGETAVIQGNSGLQESWVFTVPSLPRDFRIRGVWPHSEAGQRLRRGRDLTEASTSWVPGGVYTISHVHPATNLRVPEDRFPRRGPSARIPALVVDSGGASGKPMGRGSCAGRGSSPAKVRFQAKTILGAAVGLWRVTCSSPGCAGAGLPHSCTRPSLADSLEGQREETPRH